MAWGFLNVLNKNPPTSTYHARAHPQFTVLTHIEDDKFLWVNIFQNIILYTNIYIYTLCRKLYTCLHKKKKKALRYYTFCFCFFFLVTRDTVESLKRTKFPSRIQSFVPVLSPTHIQQTFIFLWDGGVIVESQKI